MEDVVCEKWISSLREFLIVATIIAVRVEIVPVEIIEMRVLPRAGGSFRV